MNSRYFTGQHPSFIGMIGISNIDITPPVNIYSRNWGAAKEDIAEGIHMPLQLSCITFQASEETKPLVLISADLGWWKNSTDEWMLRKKILESLQISASHLMFCLSHTHSGPSISSDDIDNQGGHLISPYLEFLAESAIKAIKQSLSDAKLRTLTWKYGKCSLAVNRDVKQLDKAGFAVGFNPEQEADDTLLVGRITDMEGRIEAIIVNYACHPTTLGWNNRLISPDYIGPMRELIEKETQSSCLFLQGASGDLSPAEQYVSDVKVSEAYGRQLAYAVLSTLAGMLPAGVKLSSFSVVESGAPLAVWERSAFQVPSSLAVELVFVDLPLKPLPSLAEIEQEWRQCEDSVLKERLWRKRGVRQSVGGDSSAKIGVWIWRLGDSFLIGQPTETYSQYQIKLRENLLPNAVAVMNVVNGHIGYLPPQHLYDQEIYSVWQTPFASRCLEILTMKTIDVAKTMI